MTPDSIGLLRFFSSSYLLLFFILFIIPFLLFFSTLTLPLGLQLPVRLPIGVDFLLLLFLSCIFFFFIFLLMIFSRLCSEAGQDYLAFFSSSSHVSAVKLDRETFCQAVAVVIAYAAYLPSVECFALLPVASTLARTGADTAAALDYNIDNGCVTITAQKTIR